MEKTDSILNLTKPSLYGIYNSSSANLNLENEDVEEYIDGQKLRIKSEGAGPTKTQVRTTTPTPLVARGLATAVFQLAVVTLAALAYNNVLKNVHTTHVDRRGADINAYLNEFLSKLKPGSMVYSDKDLGLLDGVVALLVEGLLLSGIVPMLDRVMPQLCTVRIMSSNPGPGRRSDLLNDIVRSLIAFLGISYAIRNIPWKSSLQMASTWSLINPGLWLILDGTINGLVASLGVATVGSGIIYGHSGRYFSGPNESLFTIFLFIASFFFCGVIIFGKLGRYLFGQK